MCFSDTWLNENDSDDSLNIEGFTITRSGRTGESGKQNGGGVSFYFNQLWANKKQYSFKKQICNEDIELLSVYVRPYYLPREFTQVIFTAVYIHPKANATVAEGILLYDCLQDQASDHPDAVRLIMGDSHCNLKSTCLHLKAICDMPHPPKKNSGLVLWQLEKSI